jgi:DNA-binding MltR family transcriptional regulator
MAKSKSEAITLEQLAADRQTFLNNESDLGCVVIGAAFVDDLLVSLLKTKFIPNSDVVNKVLDGSLGNFSARADIAYCLGLIPKHEYQDIILIGEIRNLFAHSRLELNFNDKEIQEKCQRLKTQSKTLVLPDNQVYKLTNKDQFVVTIAGLSNKYLNSRQSKK